MSQNPNQKRVALYDHMGRPLKEEIPQRLSAAWCRNVYYKGPARVGKYDKDGQEGDAVREELVRAQAPYIVTLLIYSSKFQVGADEREYFVYAPLEPQKAAEVAIRLWQRWEKPRNQGTKVDGDEFKFGDMREIYPKVGEGVCAEPMDDADYDAHWKDVKKRAHFKAGNPDDPFAFTCTEQDVKLHKVTDFQAGLNVKIR